MDSGCFLGRTREEDVLTDAQIWEDGREESGMAPSSSGQPREVPKLPRFTAPSAFHGVPRGQKESITVFIYTIRTDNPIFVSPPYVTHLGHDFMPRNWKKKTSERFYSVLK